MPQARVQDNREGVAGITEALLARNMLDYLEGSQKLRREAESWLRSPHFRNACDYIGADADVLLRRLGLI